MSANAYTYKQTDDCLTVTLVIIEKFAFEEYALPRIFSVKSMELFCLDFLHCSRAVLRLSSSLAHNEHLLHAKDIKSRLRPSHIQYHQRFSSFQSAVIVPMPDAIKRFQPRSKSIERIIECLATKSTSTSEQQPPSRDHL